MSMEWRQIPKFDNYEISNEGEIRSWRAKNGRGRASFPTILAGTLAPNGYVFVFLGRGIRRPIHRLVLEAFVGPCPEGMECCHKDGNRANNHLDNLRWGTHVSNMRDQYSHGTRIIGEAHPMATLTDNEVKEIHRLANEGKRGIGRQLAAKYGVTAATISLIKLGKTRNGAIHV